MLALLAGIWGASFLLIEIGLRDLEPGFLVWLRIASAALALLVAIPFATGVRRALELLRRSWRPLTVLGLVNTAIPFFLIAWGQQFVDSGVAAILNSSAPLFTAVLALAFVRSERVTGTRLLGFVVGFAGVALVAGVAPLGGGASALAGSLAIVAAAVCYALGVLYASRRTSHIPSDVLSFGVLASASVFALPAALVALPTEAPGWKPLAAVLVLGVVATGFAFLLYYALIAGSGASRAILVTYLVPSLAVVYGAVLLDESVRLASLVGLALVLGGVALGTGVLRVPARKPAASLAS